MASEPRVIGGDVMKGETKFHLSFSIIFHFSFFIGEPTMSLVFLR